MQCGKYTVEGATRFCVLIVKLWETLYVHYVPELVSPIKDRFGRRDESDHLGGCGCDVQRKGGNFLKLGNVNKSEKEGPPEEVFRR